MQHPILGVIRGAGPPNEGDVLLRVAHAMRTEALTLPEQSPVRADLLASAADWTTAARLLGAHVPALRTA